MPRQHAAVPLEPASSARPMAEPGQDSGALKVVHLQRHRLLIGLDLGTEERQLRALLYPKSYW